MNFKIMLVLFFATVTYAKDDFHYHLSLPEKANPVADMHLKLSIPHVKTVSKNSDFSYSFLKFRPLS